MSDKLDALEFTQMEANFWRMKYLKAQEELKKAVKAEREACAKLCDDDSNMWVDHHECAAAIRARGEKP
jgi:hypothetical protein